MRKVLVTGGSGFIGYHLIKRLVEEQCQVSCLVRPTANVDLLKELGGTLCYGSLNDPPSLEASMEEPDVIFHVAGRVRARHANEFLDANLGGTERLVRACLKQCAQPPVFVFVSSLAAVGPSRSMMLKRETDIPAPISSYGKSKLAAEKFLVSISEKLPCSIVRPGIVFGARDQMNLELFQTIEKMGFCPIPGWRDKKHSWIHVDDLVEILIRVANHGERLQRDSLSGTNCGHGIYFAVTNEMVALSEIGRLIGNALGRAQTRAVKCPPLAVLTVSTYYEILKRMTGRDQPYDWDKANESRYNWLCSSEKVSACLGISSDASLAQQIEQTANWYKNHGFLANDFSPESSKPT